MTVSMPVLTVSRAMSVDDFIDGITVYLDDPGFILDAIYYSMIGAGVVYVLFRIAHYAVITLMGLGDD